MHNKIVFAIAAGVILLIGAYLFISHESQIPVLFVSEDSKGSEVPKDRVLEADEDEGKNRINQDNLVDGDGEIPTEPITIEVYISGSVIEPGVYSFEDGARVTDGLERAGGFDQTAAQSAVNLARLMVDGEQIYFPSEEEVDDGFITAGGAKEDTSKGIDLNRASLNELMDIPGVGESKGKAIIQYREKNDGFSTIEELMQVPGIKEASFEMMREYICVG